MLGRRLSGGPLTERLNPWGNAPASAWPSPTPTQEEPAKNTPGKSSGPRDVIYTALAPVLGKLDTLETSDEAVVALRREWYALAERTTELLENAEAARRRWLEEQITELTPQCRRELDALNVLRSEGSRLEGIMHTLDEPYSNAKLQLTVTREERPSDDAFPTEEELAAWRKRVQAAEAEVDHQVRKREDLQQLMEINNEERRRVALRLKELKEQRQQYKDELAGKPKPGPFGLRGATIDM